MLSKIKPKESQLAHRSWPQINSNQINNHMTRITILNYHSYTEKNKFFNKKNTHTH